MSITFTKAYVANGKTFATLREAQIEGLDFLLKDICLSNSKETIVADILVTLVDNSDQVLNILTTKENSRPKARGSKKPRKNRMTEPATTTAA